MGTLIDIASRRFGRLVAAERIGADSHRTSLWRCVCDCGVTKIIRGAALRSGNTRSCGCLHREELAERNARDRTKSVVTYTGLHWRLQGAYGSASRRTCVDCRMHAAEWSYDGLDPSALRDEKGRPYSLDLSRYVPRCVSCHRLRDARGVPS